MLRKFVLIILVIAVAGCVPFFKRNRNVDYGISDLSLYSGPKAKITLTEFDIKTSKASALIALGLKDMLADELLRTNRFIVLSQEDLKAALEKQANSKIIPNLALSITIVAFEPPASGGSSGMGGGGGSGSGDLGGLLGSSDNKAHIALEIKIINTLNSQVLFLTKAQAQASDNPTNTAVLNGALSIYSKTVMESAIRRCIHDAVVDIVQNIPLKYYKY